MMKLPGQRLLPKRHDPPGHRITALAPGIILLPALAWLGHELGFEERIVLFRYLALVFTGCMAFITPHLLFPDNEKTLILQLNLSPRKLFQHHVCKLRALWIFAVAALLLMAFTDVHQPFGHLPEKAGLFGTGFVALSAIMMYALLRFVTIGERSQQWHERKTGKQMFDLAEKIGKSTPVDAGMVPTFMSTIMVTVIGMMSVVIAAAIPLTILSVLPFALLAAWSGYRLHTEVRRYDRLYYQSDAFYNELFTNPVTGTQESREPARYDAVYWVPHRWRAAVWSQIIQMDRKRPMGRIIALLSFTYWLLIWLGVPESWHTGWLLFWILSKNMMLWPVSSSKISPPVFHWWLMPPRDWIMVRFFLQIRWSLALVLTVALAALFSGSVKGIEIPVYFLFDVIASLATAWLLVRNNEYAFQKRYV